MSAPTSVTIELLADRPELIEPVAMMRWREWGHAPAPEDPDFWRRTTRAEAGRDALPVTYVAVDTSGQALGAIGLDCYDIEERQETSPWIAGMIVDPELRGVGVGTALMNRLERWAVAHGFDEAWVATERARGFYERCGWQWLEMFVNADGEETDVLHKGFSGTGAGTKDA
jgi:GNAT superfamily N-acetyltransferase